MPVAGVSQLPTSNVAGNNQMSPGSGIGPGMSPSPVFQPTQGAGTVPSNNPMLSVAPTSTPVAGAGTVPAAGVPGGGTYNTTSHYAGGQTDINKQLVDIFGKGVGGSLDNLMKNLSGTDSQIFQQWLASQVPAQQQAETALHGSLGSMGVSGNSSVMGLAEANLGANFNAQAAAENANLMQQGISTTSNILQNAEGIAEQQVSQSGWDIAKDVIGTATDALGAVGGLGGLGKLGGGISKLFSGGGIPASIAAPVSGIPGVSLGSAPDLSMFASGSGPSIGLGAFSEGAGLGI